MNTKIIAAAVAFFLVIGGALAGFFFYNQAEIAAVAKERGYDYKLLDDTVDAITRLCKDMLKQSFDKVQLEEPNGDVIKMVVDGNRVKITRIQKRQMTL